MSRVKRLGEPGPCRGWRATIEGDILKIMTKKPKSNVQIFARLPEKYHKHCTIGNIKMVTIRLASQGKVDVVYDGNVPGYRKVM